MTDEQRDEQLGRLVREHTEFRKKIASLNTEAQNLSKLYRGIGETLAAHPQNLLFSGQSHDGRFASGFVVNANDIDGKKLLQLTNEIRDAIVQRDGIAQQLKALGYDISTL
jgi:hypothetical protein